MARNKKKERIKSIVIYSVAMMLIIGGLLKGWIIEAKEEEEVMKGETDGIEEKESYSDLEGEDDSPEESDEESSKKNDGEDIKEGDREGDPLDDLKDINIKDLPKEERTHTVYEDKLSDYFNEKDISKTKKIGKNFVEVYHEFDGSAPVKNIEESKKYMTDELYKKMTGDQESVIRPTKDFFERKVKDIEVREPRTISDEEIVWEVRVIAEVFGESGKKTDEKLTVYTLRFKEVGDKYKVSDYSTDIPY